VLKKDDEATALYTQLAERYPNHPVAPIAKQRLDGK
jgi:TolA-binding protein